MDEDVKRLWAKMTEAQCQYCKHYVNLRLSNGWACSHPIVLIEDLKALKCPYYEWDSQLTKADFIDYERN